MADEKIDAGKILVDLTRKKSTQKDREGPKASGLRRTDTAPRRNKLKSRMCWLLAKKSTNGLSYMFAKC